MQWILCNFFLCCGRRRIQAFIMSWIIWWPIHYLIRIVWRLTVSLPRAKMLICLTRRKACLGSVCDSVKHRRGSVVEYWACTRRNRVRIPLCRLFTGNGGGGGLLRRTWPLLWSLNRFRFKTCPSTGRGVWMSYTRRLNWYWKIDAMWGLRHAMPFNVTLLCLSQINLM